MYVEYKVKRNLLIAGSVLFVLGAAFVVVGGYVGYVTLEDYIENQIVENVVLKDNTVQLERWLVTPFPITYRIYFFNITNADEVLEGGVPVVEEIGPYCYRQYKYNDVIEMDEDTIEFNERMWLEFDEEMSGDLRESDVVTIANIPYLAVLQTIEADYSLFIGLVNNLLTNIFGDYDEPIMTVNVRDFLIDGVTLCADPGLLGAAICAILRTQAVNNENMEVNEDNSIKFAFLLPKMNGTGDWFKIKRGIESHQELGHIIEWNGRSTLSNWLNPTGELSQCNMINGTNGGTFSPFLKRSEHIEVFNADICRSVIVEYTEDFEYHGIGGYRYTVGDYLFSNREGCFCLDATPGVTEEFGCLYYGALELYTCRGAHLVASSPHFLFAHPIYQTGVIGLNPDPEKHQIFLDLEPNTGTPLRAAKRAQFNIFLRPITSITQTNNLTSTLMPFLWMEDSLELSEEYTDEIKSSLLRPKAFVNIGRIVLLSVGSFLFVLGIILILLPLFILK